MQPRLSLITLGVNNLQRSLEFYRDGLGFPTTRDVSEGIIFFQTQGVALALYPYSDLANDISSEFNLPRAKFSGITLAHNVRTRAEVDQVISQAYAAGAIIEKPPADTEWGGYSGYFSDPDGYVWEVAFGAFEFSKDGSLIIP